MLTSVPEELVLMTGRSSLPKAPAGPTRSTVMGEMVELTGPVFVTRDSMAMRKVLVLLEGFYCWTCGSDAYSGVASVILMSVTSNLELLTIY